MPIIKLGQYFSDITKKMEAFSEILIDAHYKTWAVFSDIAKNGSIFWNFPQGVSGNIL